MSGRPRCDGDHYSYGATIDPTREEDRRDLALLIEGTCPTCGVTARRTDDGFAACPCCGVEWAISNAKLVIRLAIPADADA